MVIIIVSVLGLLLCSAGQLAPLMGGEERWSLGSRMAQRQLIQLAVRNWKVSFDDEEEEEIGQMKSRQIRKPKVLSNLVTTFAYRKH